jgi:HEPN domain-containing protein
MTSPANNWLKAAADDLAAIEAMLPNDQLTNVIDFHAQQAVEKSFKGLREHQTSIDNQKKSLTSAGNQDGNH